jgi:UDP-glucose 4-epimerase
MRVVVFGASGNIGSSLLRALGEANEVTTIVGVARRAPTASLPKVEWRQADVALSDLSGIVAGADAVVHLAWRIQPSHNLRELIETNVAGTQRVLDAARAARVGTVIAGSSVGAYAPGSKDEPVDESWPTTGLPSSFYARHKAAMERALDRFEAQAGDTRVVRVRPGLVFQRPAAAEIRRLFAGPLLPGFLLSPGVFRLLPEIPGLRFQAVHADDVARVYRAALLDSRFRGAVNVAADPVLDMVTIADAIGARLVTVPSRLARAALDGLWRARLQPSPPGWLDMALAVPIMSTSRMRDELGIRCERTSLEALAELVAGIRHGNDAPTPPLSAAASGLLRLRELRAMLMRRELC